MGRCGSRNGKLRKPTRKRVEIFENIKSIETSSLDTFVKSRDTLVYNIDY